ncbi:MAG: hypothetical protein ACR2NR_22105 [Solirubrobacteraceae bacterium]
MRNVALHRQLENFTVDASGRLTAEASRGAEIPFEVTEERTGGRAGGRGLYVYRPLTGEFIRTRDEALRALPSHAGAAAALASSEALDAYLIERGEVKVPADRRGQAEAALVAFLAAVFEERSEFGFEPAHFEAAYAELERTLYAGHCTATVVAPVLGIALDPGTIELTLADGLMLIRGDALADAPVEAVWGDTAEPHVLAVLAIDQERSDRPPVSIARAQFRRIVSALRLFERGGYALGPVAWARADNDPAARWRPVSIGVSGRVGGARLLTLVPAAQEEELRAFYRLVARRPRGGGELAWALARFEMGCERLDPSEGLTDYLLALRVLLEPEGPASGRLAQRLAVICAAPEDRAGLARRIARAVSLERAVIGAIGPQPESIGRPGFDSLVDELAEHLRAILRDALCGHLDVDLCAVADELLAEAAAAPAR